MDGHNSSSEIIRLSKVVKSYSGASVLHELDFSVGKGEFITLIGRSGSGKTTLLKLINGLIDPDGGTILVFGEDIATVDHIRLRRRIGYVIQGIGLFPHLNVKNNIVFIPKILKYDKDRQEAIALKLIQLVGMDRDTLSRYPSELSGGQQQRIGVARALAASPEILLMDEPFGSLDAITRAMLQDELLRIHAELGITIIFITHDIQEAEKLGTRVVVLENGVLKPQSSDLLSI